MNSAHTLRSSSIAASILLGAAIVASTMHAPQTSADAPTARQALAVQTHADYLPAHFFEEQRVAAVQALPAQF